MSEPGGRPVPVRLDAVRCPECGTCMDLEPILMARDLAIVSALVQELGIVDDASRRVKELLDGLARKSVTLCTDIGHYGYDLITEEEEPELPPGHREPKDDITPADD